MRCKGILAVFERVFFCGNDAGNTSSKNWFSDQCSEILRKQKFSVMIRTFATPIEQLVYSNPLISSLRNEDVLNLEMDDVDSVEGQARLQRSQSNLRLSRIPPIIDIAQISSDQMEILYNKVSGFTTPQKQCLTALIVHHAMETVDGKDVYNPLYQPVFLKWIRKDHVSQTNVYELKEQGNYYVLNGSEKFSQRTDYDDRKNLYKGRFEICPNHNHPPVFRSFIDNPPTDTKCALFPFQLIFTLMKHNGNDTVLLHHSVNGTGSNEMDDIPLYHSILLSSKRITNTGLFAGKYANRSHLCPPCSETEFGFNLTH